MPTPKPKKVGRPKLPKGHAKGRVLGLRLTDEEVNLFTTAAKSKKQTFSEWVRTTLAEAAAQ
jgi:uncharacterized protein (DUF1778 family)